MFTTPMDYTELEKSIAKLTTSFPFCECFSIGKSWEGRELYCLKLGNGPKKALYVGAHHSLEWCTSQILMQFAAEYCQKLQNGDFFKGYKVSKIFEGASIFIIPMLNPDGIELTVNGISEEHPLFLRVTKMINKSTDFSTWQANIRGVDLNHNYNAGWNEGKVHEQDMNIFFPGPTRYSGEYPESEKESAALCAFVRGLKPDMVIAFHSQGREIYYDFRGKLPPNAENLASIYSKLCGYRLEKPTGITSFGGFKDWFIEEYNKPGFTLECGEGKNPLTAAQTEAAYNELKELMLSAPMFI